MITLGGDGIYFRTRGGSLEGRIPTQARAVFDVTGAGDTVVAHLAFHLGAGLDLEAAVVKEPGVFPGAEVEEGRGIAGHALLDRAGTGPEVTLNAQSAATLAHREGEVVTGTGERMVTGGAGEIPVSAELAIEKQEPTEFDLGRVRLGKAAGLFGAGRAQRQPNRSTIRAVSSTTPRSP